MKNLQKHCMYFCVLVTWKGESWVGIMHIVYYVFIHPFIKKVQVCFMRVMTRGLEGDMLRQVDQHEGSRTASVTFSWPCCRLGDSPHSVGQKEERWRNHIKSWGSWWESDTQWVTWRTMHLCLACGLLAGWERRDSRDIDWLTELRLIRGELWAWWSIRGRTGFAFTPSSFKMTRSGCIKFLSADTQADVSMW